MPCCWHLNLHFLSGEQTVTFTKAYLVAWVLRTRESENEPQVGTALAAECWTEEVHQSVSLSSHLSSKAGGCRCQSSLQDLRAVSCPPPVRGRVRSLFIDKQLFTHLPSTHHTCSSLAGHWSPSHLLASLHTRCLKTHLLLCC